MKTISAAINLDLTPKTSHRSPLEMLLKNHPAGVLYNLSIADSSARGVTLELRLGSQMSSDTGANWGGLGCVMDCAARMAALRAMGSCVISECEMSFRAPVSGRVVFVTAQIDPAAPGYAIYRSAIYIVEQQDTTLVAESQGTLLKQAFATSNRQSIQ